MPALSQPVIEAFNDQINAELYSAYVYLSMSAHCDATNFDGAAKWLRQQWGEELGHATKLIDFIAERGGRVSLKAIKEPEHEWPSLLALFRQVLQHEQEVTASIYRIYDVSAEQKDYASQTLLQWYINEQVEEENSAQEIVSRLELAGDSGSALLIVDRELALRAPAGSGPGVDNR